MVESHLPKVVVAGPSPVPRSIFRKNRGPSEMKIFIYKSREDLIEGVRSYKKTQRKKWTFLAIESPARKLVGIKDFEGEHYWALPVSIAETNGLSTGKEKASLAALLSTRTRKK
jgi:hypothetical protein